MAAFFFAVQWRLWIMTRTCVQPLAPLTLYGTDSELFMPLAQRACLCVTCMYGVVLVFGSWL